MTQTFANNAITTLSANINSAVTSLTVAAATGFPTSASYTILIDSELMLVTAGAGTTSWTVTRGVEGTTAAAHTSGAQVEQILTLAGLQSLGDGFWTFLRPTGLSGAIQQTRLVGATASGSPVSGTFQLGDVVIDQSGGIWICTVPGSPGTWVPASRNTYRARMYLNNPQTLPTGTWTNIPFDTVDFDDSPGATMAVTGSTAHMVTTVAGLYLIDVQYIIPSATGNTRVVCDLAEAAFTGGYVPGANTWRITDDAKVGVANAYYTAGRSLTLKLPAATSVYAGAFQTSTGVNFVSGTQPQATWFGMDLLSVS